MSKRARAASRRSGFTLPEILVSVAMVGVLGAVTIPAVTNQINKSEISRVVQDLQSIGQAAQLYRTDTGEWPTDTDDLVEDPSVSGWKGPYLTRVTTGNILTGADGTISQTLSSGTPTGGTVAFFRISLTGLNSTDAQAVDLQLDAGDSGSANWYSSGLIQTHTASTTSNDLYFFPVVIK